MAVIPDMRPKITWNNNSCARFSAVGVTGMERTTRQENRHNSHQVIIFGRFLTWASLATSVRRLEVSSIFFWSAAS
jgi:hypothetical protein